MLRSNYSNPKNHGYDSICYGVDNDGNGWLNLTDNTIYFRMRFVVRDYDSNQVYSPWTEVFTVGKSVDDEVYIASDWAQEELAAAGKLGLIPEVLQGADLKKPITRAEFAAVCVKTYESLSGVTAQPAAADTFTDTQDAEVLKASALGITNGKYDNGARFAPDEGLNRQEAAAMLTRVYKKATVEGWTLASDKDFPLTYEKPAAFADDAAIAGYAKDSVYFMVANGLIKGFTEDNTFRPVNTTEAQTAIGYANATRQQALLIAVRMVQNLGN